MGICHNCSFVEFSFYSSFYFLFLLLFRLIFALIYVFHRLPLFLNNNSPLPSPLFFLCSSYSLPPPPPPPLLPPPPLPPPPPPPPLSFPLSIPSLFLSSSFFPLEGWGGGPPACPQGQSQCSLRFIGRCRPPLIFSIFHS